MDSIRNEIINCTKCNLCKTRNNAVPGEGSLKAKIMFIGEAPGANEDRDGIPFCGRSGSLLNSMLESIELTRKDVFITNIVKCRPPENRDPNEIEIERCSPFLKLQFDIIKPKIICTLGRLSMSLFFKDKKISEIHGKKFKLSQYTVIPMYHPAVGLYNPNMKKILFEDFLMLKNL